MPGDFDGDFSLTATDIDRLSSAVLRASTNLTYDLNADGAVSAKDRIVWIEDLKHTWFGDADLSGEFNSEDFVLAFQAGKYETGQSADWSEGDWDGDGVFDSDDFIIAFQDGGYEQGPRTDAAAVPEPGGVAADASGARGRDVAKAGRAARIAPDKVSGSLH